MVRLGLGDLVRAGAADFNPVLAELLTWPVVRLIGFNEIGLRLPALLASVVALLLGWQLIYLYILDSKARLVALAGLCLMPFQFWTAQDGRMYALMGALYLGGALFAYRGRWLGLAACAGLLMYCHNTGVFYALSLFGFAWLGRRSFKEPTWLWIGLAGLIAGISFLPWLPHELASTGGTFWLGPLTPDLFLLAMERIFFADTLPLAFVAMAVIVIGASLAMAFLANLWAAIEWRDLEWLELPAIAIGPLVLMLVLSLGWKNVIFYRPLASLATPLTVWFVFALRRIPTFKWTFAYGWVVLLALSLVGWQPQSKAGEIRQLARTINENWQAGDVIYHATATSLLPFQEYSQHPSYLLDELQPDGLLRRSLQDVFGLRRLALEALPHQRAWLIWARDPQDTPAANARMLAYTQGAILIGRVHAWQFSMIEVYLQEQPWKTLKP